MKIPTKSLLEERFAEFEDLVADGEAFPAVAALGKALRLTATSSKDRSDFVRDLRLRAQPKHLRDAATEATTSWRRVTHILSIGTKFDEDELLLVLTLRLQIELVADVLRIFGIDAGELALATIDDELHEIANSKENRRAFANAFSLLKKNCGIPVENHWGA